MEFVQELLRPFVSELGQVREQLGAERARREMAEGRAATLEAKLEALRAPESDAKMPIGPTPEEASEAAQEATEPRSWWGSLWVDAVIAILVVVGLALLITLILTL